MCVDGAVSAREKIWYELVHDGTRWNPVREQEYVYCSEDYRPTDVEYIILKEKALGWLLTFATQHPTEASPDT